MNSLRIFHCVPTLLLLLLVTSSPVQAQSDAQPARARELNSTVFHWRALPAKPTANGQRREVNDTPTATLEQFECHITTLNPGAVSHAPHQHPQEELLILKDGTLDVSINGDTHRAGPGSVIFFAAFDLHAVKNVGETPATYYVMNFVTAATRQLTQATVGQRRATPHLTSRVLDWSTLKMIPTPKGARRDFFDSPTVTCANLESHATTIRSGEIPHPSHRHVDEELVVVKQGIIEVTINGTIQRAEEGSIAFFRSNDEHGLKNVGPDDATYYIIRVVADGAAK